MLRFPIFYAVLAFAISIVIVKSLLPELACMDGWESPSIGKSGACSHHGGVNRIPEIIGLIVSFIFSFWVWKKLKNNEDKLNDPENKIINQAERVSIFILSSLIKGVFFVHNLTRIGITKAFYRWPIITVVVSFIVIIILHLLWR